MTFLGIAGRDEPGAMAKFADLQNVRSFEHIADESGQVWVDFGVIVQPSYAFVQQDGTVELITGGIPADNLAERLEALAAS